MPSMLIRLVLFEHTAIAPKGKIVSATPQIQTAFTLSCTYLHKIRTS